MSSRILAETGGQQPPPKDGSRSSTGTRNPAISHMAQKTQHQSAATADVTRNPRLFRCVCVVGLPQVLVVVLLAAGLLSIVLLISPSSDSDRSTESGFTPQSPSPPRPAPTAPQECHCNDSVRLSSNECTGKTQLHVQGPGTFLWVCCAEWTTCWLNGKVVGTAFTRESSLWSNCRGLYRCTYDGERLKFCSEENDCYEVTRYDPWTPCTC